MFLAEDVTIIETEDSDPPNNESYSNGTDENILEGADEWPKIHILKVEDIIKREENRINQTIASNQPSEIEPLPAVPIETISNAELLSAFTQSAKENAVYKKLMSQKVTMMEEQLQQQQTLLQEIHQQLQELDKKQSKKMAAEPNHVQLKNVITKQIDSTFTRNLTDQSKMFESWMITRSNKEREYQESLMSAVSQVIGNNIVDKLDTVSMGTLFPKFG